MSGEHEHCRVCGDDMCKDHRHARATREIADLERKLVAPIKCGTCLTELTRQAADLVARCPTCQADLRRKLAEAEGERDRWLQIARGYAKTHRNVYEDREATIASNGRLRHALCKAIRATGAGAGETCSLDFLCGDGVREIELCIANLRGQRADALARAERAEGGARFWKDGHKELLDGFESERQARQRAEASAQRWQEQFQDEACRRAKADSKLTDMLGQYMSANKARQRAEAALERLRGAFSKLDAAYRNAQTTDQLCETQIGWFIGKLREAFKTHPTHAPSGEVERCDECSNELAYMGLNERGGEVYDCPLCKAREELRRLREVERAARKHKGTIEALATSTTNKLCACDHSLDWVCLSCAVDKFCRDLLKALTATDAGEGQKRSATEARMADENWRKNVGLDAGLSLQQARGQALGHLHEVESARSEAAEDEARRALDAGEGEHKPDCDCDKCVSASWRKLAEGEQGSEGGGE